MDIAPFFFCVFYVDLTFGSVYKQPKKNLASIPTPWPHILPKKW